MTKCSNGTNQSPIDINSNKIKTCSSTCNLSFYYRSSKCNLIMANKNVILDYDVGSSVSFNHDVYELDKISFTTPSSHKLDSSSYPLEAHLYHRSVNTGKILIIAVFIEINEASSKSKLFLEKFEDSIPSRRGEQLSINTNDAWNVFDILPENKAFYLYEGSLPRPPCTENVTWIIMEEPINCSDIFHKQIKKRSKNNARSIQKLNNRTIYYNSNSLDKSSRNYGNKLRCYTDKEFRKACARISNNSEVVTYKSYSNLAITITVVVIVLFILLILWILEKGLLKNLVPNIKNIVNKKLINQ